MMEKINFKTINTSFFYEIKKETDDEETFLNQSDYQQYITVRFATKIKDEVTRKKTKKDIDKGRLCNSSDFDFDESSR
jgi:hypothetical protein